MYDRILGIIPMPKLEDEEQDKENTHKVDVLPASAIITR
jgi:hypothetical protein